MDSLRRPTKLKKCGLSHAFPAIYPLFLTALAAIILSTFLSPRWVFAAEPPFSLPPPQELAKLRSAVIYTDKGEMYFDLFPEEAPWHVANFKYLADRGWYRGKKFHLFHPDYIIQGGAPAGDPDGGPGWSLPAEFNNHKHIAGALGMARAPNIINPERRSNGSQFHILITLADGMDGAYTVFGQLRRGMPVLKSLNKGDLIKDVKVFVRDR